MFPHPSATRRLLEKACWTLCEDENRAARVRPPSPAGQYGREPLRFRGYLRKNHYLDSTSHPRTRRRVQLHRYSGGRGRRQRVGEVVFNTAMTGYQEILTDPSYAGQMVTLTCPHIGNTGANAEDEESETVHARALLVRDVPALHSNFRASESLQAYLKRRQVVAIANIDTRALTRHLRSSGAQAGCVVAGATVNAASAPGQGKSVPGSVGRGSGERCHLRRGPVLDGRYLVVGCFHATVASRQQARGLHGQQARGLHDQQARGLHDQQARGLHGQQARGLHDQQARTGSSVPEPASSGADPFHVVAVDYGVKRNILRLLVDRGCRVTVVPATMSAQGIRDLMPDGLFLSNGPGDPEPCGYAIDMIRTLTAERLPTFGICLGHQLLALASGARTVKMKFGHHGANHPVLDTATGRVMISSQNHSFAVDAESLNESLAITHVSLFDQSLQGIRRLDVPAFSFQGHPEASPGPHDVQALFDHFIDLMKTSRGGERTAER